MQDLEFLGHNEDEGLWEFDTHIIYLKQKKLWDAADHIADNLEWIAERLYGGWQEHERF